MIHGLISAGLAEDTLQAGQGSGLAFMLNDALNLPGHTVEGVQKLVKLLGYPATVLEQDPRPSPVSLTTV